MKLKNIKQPPLLNPPSVRDLTIVSDVDVKIFLDSLEKSRHGGERSVLNLHLSLQRIGAPQVVTEQDKKVIQNALEDCRNKGDYSDLLVVHSQMKTLGLPSTISQDDLELVRYTLKKLRGESFGEGGEKIALIHINFINLGINEEITPRDVEMMESTSSEYLRRGWVLQMLNLRSNMREIGIPVELSRTETERVNKEASECREGMDGWALAQFHFLMREFWVPLPLTTKDIDAFRHSLEGARRERSWGKISLMQGYMLGLSSLDGVGREIPEIPPLKEFLK